MTNTTATANNWVNLDELCTTLNTTANIVGVSSRRSYQYAGADTVDFLFEGVIIRKQGKYTKARYKIISNAHSL